MRANLAWLDEVFAEAAAQHRLGVVLFTQADMFSLDKNAHDADGFTEILAALSKARGGLWPAGAADKRRLAPPDQWTNLL